LELSKSNEVGEKYGFILGLKELLLKSISQTIINKKEKSKQPNKHKKEKSKQAYTRVNLDLNNS